MEDKKDEIICISSDEDTGQDKTNNKHLPVDKQLEDNCVSYVKMETSLSNAEQIQNHKQKRNISEINSDDDSYIKRNKKTFICDKENSVETCNMIEKEKQTEEEKEKDKTLLKPKLIIKEKKTVSSVEQDIFPMFISLCLQKDRSEDMKVIVNKLKRRYDQLSHEYAHCEAFINFLNEKRNDIIYSKNKLYTYIAEVMNEMKNSCRGKSSLLLNNKNCYSGENKLNKANDLNIPSTSCLNTLSVSSSIVNNSEIISTSADNEEEQEKQDAVQNKIHRVLKGMRKCEKYIKMLEDMEVDFDDEHNSNYIKLERYKHRMVQLYNKYCEYTGENTDAGRQYLRPKHFSTTGIVTVDHAITNFINSKISKTNKLRKIGSFVEALIFPDYTDILRCVTKCNELHNLGLDSKKQQQIAKKAFIELGEYLQRCRRNDYWDTFSLSLENQEDDPALKDPTLAEKLIQNKREGEKRLSSIFKEYEKKQEELKDQITDSKASSENEEDDEEDSAENDNEDDNENDDISEIDMTSDLNIHSDEDENIVDADKVFKNKINSKIKPDKKESNTDITEETQYTKSNDKLKNNDNGPLIPEKIDNIKNMSNCKTNTESESIKGKNTSTDMAKPSNNLPKVILPAITNNEIPIDKTKEDEASIMDVDSIDNKPLVEKVDEEEEQEQEKPLLRVRSFAKPPTTWEDIERIEERNKDKSISDTLTNKDIIDLTQESPKENSTVCQSATIQIGSKVLSATGGNYRTVVIPAGKSIINVKNITNNYLRLNTSMNSNDVTKLESDQIISSQQIAGKNTKSRTIRLPTNSSTNQKMSASDQAQHSQSKQSTTVQISQSNEIIVLPMIQVRSTSQCSKTNPPVSQAK